MRFRIVLSAAALALLAACSPVDVGLGEAVKYDMALQTINPDPVYAADAAKPGSSGARAAAAAERYRKGTVKPVEEIRSTQSSSGSSGSGTK